jgi:hypothetical protein
MQTEYVAFFKNKQRIRSELTALGKQVNERIDHYRQTVESCKDNVEAVSGMLPCLVETIRILKGMQMNDNESRQAMSTYLKNSAHDNSSI